VRTFAELEKQFTSAEAGGFDLRQEQVATLLNEGAERLAARSKWIRAMVQVGPTVAGQGPYRLPDKLVQLEQLYVDGKPWPETDMLTLRQVELGRRALCQAWGDGIYAEEADETGTIKLLRLFPAPELDGLTIEGWGPITPDPLGGEDVLPFPPEFTRAVLDFALAIAYEQIDENPQSATYFLERANGRADELGERMRAKMRTNPRKARVSTLRA
jgi:hypothetical protein